jgi:hypothetical protein
MPTDEAAFLARVRELIRFLKDEVYGYDELRVYVSGIADP